MSERARKRSSKWDTKEDNSFSPNHVHISQREVQKTSAWDEGRSTWDEGRSWDEVRSAWDEGRSALDEGRGYGTRMSPGHGDRRRQRGRSPREKRDRSLRNRRSRSRSRSPGRGVRQEPVKIERNRSKSGAQCKDFSAGRCRRGDDCPLIHQGTQNYDDSREGGARRGEVSRYSSNTHDIREHERDRRRGNDTLCRFFAAGNCRSGNFCRYSHSRASESPDRRRLDEEKSIPGHNSDRASKVWEDPRLGATSSVPDAVRYDDRSGRKRARDSRDNEWSPDGKWDPHLGPDPSFSEKVISDSVMSPDWNYESLAQGKDEIQYTDSSLLPTCNKVTSLEKPGFSQNNEKLSVNNWDGQNSDQQYHQSWDVIAPTTLNRVGQNSDQQHHQSWDGIAPTTLNRVAQHDDASTMDTVPWIQKENISTPMERDPFAVGKSELHKHDSITSDITGIPPNKNAVDGEQCLTDISGSLAQLLGDGKQLPQLYAALNSTGDALPQPQPQVPVDSTVIGSTVPVLSSISAVPLEQYDPLCDSTEPQKANDSDDQLGDSSIPVESKTVANGVKDLVSSDFPSSSHADSSNNGRSSVLDKKAEESKGAGNNGQPEIIGGDKKDEENKKSKETKAVRAFKFALAEFVKELLKPSWKEGLVGKDAYKTIVKKVVDKVTDSFEGPNIPQTQEKIDSYLTLSKPKLTKLIQAYVEKFQKPK